MMDDLTDLDDAIIEDTFHCDLCGGRMVLGGNDCHVIIDAETISPSMGHMGGQLKLCECCSQRVHDAYRGNLRDAGICEHGINDGEFCEDCNREYKRARERN